MNFDPRTIPVKTTSARYDEAFERFKTFCFNSLSGVEKVIRYGSVKNPGLSDLDVLLVVKTYSLRDAYVLRRFVRTELSNYILHLPLIIPDYLFEDIPSIFPFYEYQIHTRIDSKYVKHISYSDGEIINFISQVRFTKFPEVLEKYRSKENIDVREFLLEISSFKHSITLLTLLRPDLRDNSIFKSFFNQTDLVRNASFEFKEDFTVLVSYFGTSKRAYEFWLSSVVDTLEISPKALEYLDTITLPDDIRRLNLEDCFKLWYLKLVSLGKDHGWRTSDANTHVALYDFSKYNIDLMSYVDTVTKYAQRIRFYNPGVSFLTIGIPESKVIRFIRKMRKCL